MMDQPFDDDELADYDPADVTDHSPMPADNATTATANAAALELPDRLHRHIRELERNGTTQPFRHRIALIGETRLDEARPRGTRSGALKLLEAVYANGKPHWLDPVTALAPLRDILFKQGAPPGSDRGIYYILIRLARSSISPAAFITHVLLPRMADDHDWRRWRNRHVWLLDGIADILIELRAAPPWNGERLGSSSVLSDIALCKYVGRPLCRLNSERFHAGATHLEAWTKAWQTFSFASPGFLGFMRRTILPCLYRLSGRVDIEQLAPIAAAMAGLENILGRRMTVMSPAAAEAFLASAGLADDFDRHMEARLATEGGAWAIARELRGYADLAKALANLDAGLAILGQIAHMAIGLDPDFMADAAVMVRQLQRDEGILLLRWHIQALSKVPVSERPDFIQAITTADGMHPAYPHRADTPIWEQPRLAGLNHLATELHLPTQAQWDLPGIRKSFFNHEPKAAEMFHELTNAVAAGQDRTWKMADVSRFDTIGPAFHELAIRSLIPGLGSAASLFSLKSRDMASLLQSYGRAAEGTMVAASIDIRLTTHGLPGDPAGGDAVRARVPTGFFEAVWSAITGDTADQGNAALFAALGQEAAAARRSLNEMKGQPAGQERSIAALQARLAILDDIFLILEDSSGLMAANPAGLTRRFAMAVHAAAYFHKSADHAALAVLSSAVQRYRNDPVLAALVARLSSAVAPGFMGVEQAAMLADTVNAICTAAADDPLLDRILAEATGPLQAVLVRTCRTRGTTRPAEAFDAALRRLAGYARLVAETAKWRDLLSKLASREARSGASGTEARTGDAGTDTPQQKGADRHFRCYTSRSALDAYYGDMGGICLSTKPELILRPGVMIGRLWDCGEQRIRGMCVLALVVRQKPIPGEPPRFWFAFAFNPLRSLTRGLGTNQLLTIYLAFRALAEHIALRTTLPVMLPGIGSYGLVSNDQSFASLVVNYERNAGSSQIQLDPHGLFAIHYPRRAFADAMLIIDPGKPETLRATTELIRMGASQGRAAV
jgi:hypothetical protein